MECSSGRLGVGYEGDTCTFFCKNGSKLTGSDIRTCHNGSWSGINTMCIRGINYNTLSVSLLCNQKIKNMYGNLDKRIGVKCQKYL